MTSGPAVEARAEAAVDVGQIPALDGYRAVAALFVLTTHVAFVSAAITWPLLGPVLGRLDFGVPIFFLLSGFLLFRPWAASDVAGVRRPRTRVYLRRRFARVIPAYWVMMVAALTLLPANDGATTGDWVRYALLVQNLSLPTVFMGLTHIWSLAVEVGFYLLLPVLAAALARGPADRAMRRYHWLLGALLAVGLTARLASSTLGRDTLSGLWLPAYLDWFALGMVAAVAASFPPHSGAPRWVGALRQMAADWGTCLSVGLLLFVIACTPVAGPLTLGEVTAWEATVKHVLYGASAFFLLLPAFLGRPGSAVHRAMESPILGWLGKISYGVFLWHLLLLELIRPALGIPEFSGGFLVLWPATVAATLVAAWVSWRFVETPFQRWSHRRRLNSQATTTATTVAPADTAAAAAGSD